MKVSRCLIKTGGGGISIMIFWGFSSPLLQKILAKLAFQFRQIDPRSWTIMDCTWRARTTQYLIFKLPGVLRSMLAHDNLDCTQSMSFDSLSILSHCIKFCPTKLNVFDQYVVLNSESPPLMVREGRRSLQQTNFSLIIHAV